MQIRGNGCVAGDLNGDGYTDLYVTADGYDALLWNDGTGHFSEGARAAGITTWGWHSGATIGDVNGDGRPDVFVSGYADTNAPIPTDTGFPNNYAGVRDLLYLNEGNDATGHARFREVGEKLHVDPGSPEHGLGAVFSDVNGDGRLDLYVANDANPNRLYLNVAYPGGAAKDPLGLGFRLEERAASVGSPTRAPGWASLPPTTAATADPTSSSRTRTSSSMRVFQSAPPVGRQARLQGRPLGHRVGLRHEPRRLGRLVGRPRQRLEPRSRARERRHPRDRPEEERGAGAGVREPDGARPPGTVRQSATNAARAGARRALNGRGLAAADYDNDGHVDIAVNTVGGKLMLLHNTGTKGNWLEVKLPTFAPGAVVTAVLPDGRRLVEELHAGSSYLSSEDPARPLRAREGEARWTS